MYQNNLHHSQSYITDQVLHHINHLLFGNHGQRITWTLDYLCPLSPFDADQRIYFESFEDSID